LEKRYFIDLSYKGTCYHGWQSQKNAHTVQAALEEGLIRIAGMNIRTVGAGRTDSGVHARFFTAHFDGSAGLFEDRDEFLYRINSVLPEDIAVCDIHPVTSSAHARFSAISRTYEYIISRRKDPFMTEFSWILTKPLDLEAMNQASTLLVGRHDFTSFSKLHSNVRSNLCHVQNAGWQEKNGRTVFRIEADRFLRNMVRSIVGNMVLLGTGKITIQNFDLMLESRDRAKAKGTAPAAGLFLAGISYPPEIFL
jgi:tRNA pseudouridine38-40 synthase